jgi:hypothetical protein
MIPADYAFETARVVYPTALRFFTETEAIGFAVIVLCRMHDIPLVLASSIVRQIAEEPIPLHYQRII